MKADDLLGAPRLAAGWTQHPLELGQRGLIELIRDSHLVPEVRWNALQTRLLEVGLRIERLISGTSDRQKAQCGKPGSFDLHSPHDSAPSYERIGEKVSPVA